PMDLAALPPPATVLPTAVLRITQK
ncbi:MAG: hypothetical protein QOF00_13, partial [Pseudonocardiales bacterium]|nr:hypothetical protein [Pseudonocardiales bacterium]